MSQINLKSNQAALVLNVSLEGEVNVDAVFPENADTEGDLAAAICTVVGQKLTEDDSFQAEIMAALEVEEE